MNKTILLILAAVALGFCLCVIVAAAGVFLFASTTTQPAANAGEAFMTALKDGNYSKAFAMCSPGLQRELGGNATGLERLIKNGQVVPVSWTFSSRNIENDEAELSGTVMFAGNLKGLVNLTLSQIGSEWKITGFNLEEE